ncbi:MAG: hypothetical protein ACI9MC_003062 [Kiritimatiellia bacterium]|jgi:hypothetical protein
MSPHRGRYRRSARERAGAVQELGGKALAPCLVDTNTGISMYELSDIIRHLNETYGGATP